MTDLIKTYNPANAAALTSEQLDGLQKLDSAQIKELAKAYPNGAMGGRAYLLMIDKTKPVEKQLPQLTTFENLWNLREKNSLRNWVAYRFRDNYKAPTPAQNIRKGNVKTRKVEVLDLSERETLNLPGFKTGDKQHPAQTVGITHVKKQAVSETLPEPFNSDVKKIEDSMPPKARRGRPAKTKN